MKKILIQFTHGLGDAVQLTCVLQHLKKYRPDWQLYLIAKRGKHSVGYGYCEKVWHDQEPAPDPASFDHAFDLGWFENYNGYTDCPNTKVTNCLREVFAVEVDPALLTYKLHTDPALVGRAEHYLKSIGCKKLDNGRYNAVCIHYEGNTSTERKNLTHAEARATVKAVQACGHVPVILDWDSRSPIPDQRTVFNPGVGEGDLWGNFGSGDAVVITALVSLCSLYVGIDSGPQKCAGATDTPAIGVWTKHLPVQFMDLCPNFTHLVPWNYHQLPPANQPAVRGYMEKAYRLRPYANLLSELPAEVAHVLTGRPREECQNKEFLRQLTSTAYDANYYEEHKAAGLDYAGFGDWQREYGRWLVESLGLKHKHVLDVGCACGSIVRGLGEAGAFVQGVDVSEHMVNVGRRKWPDMTPIIHTCDAINLHLYADATWDAIHSAQVAEHWRPDHVPLILKELHRVTKPGGLFVCFLDTEEMCRRQNRDAETEDPTHLCIKPQSWWHEQLAAAGWAVEPEPSLAALKNHPDSFLNRYDWAYFIARRAS